jgi:hypothetical protein
MLSRRIEQPAEERCGGAHLRLGIQPLEVQHHRRAMLPRAGGEADQLGRGIVGGIDDDMPEGVGQGCEVALGIDDHLLHLARAAFEQAAQQVRLARARIALDEQPRRQQLLQVHRHARAGAVHPHVDLDCHVRSLWRRAGGRGKRRRCESC